ncbi:unnamed protein product [Acanthoscelides obtectus]|uniref:Transposase n=1 Tax=Acanthoscelides obtectus TaxID=200917 RepID=A0A9P0LDV9_ACAOB|nr:unnamed protein product [Acanthoscelides obtectus]CAK1654807.1 Histone-lysine N-methyltransferase SETMAR [Acanthoscelides obtectus]
MVFLLDRFNSGNSKNVYSIGDEKPTKVIRSRSVSKKMEQRTVTADWYTTILQKTRQYLTEENVELLEHPPYSPDLSPHDFFTFPKIKNRLHGQRFQSPQKAVDASKNAVLDLPANEWNKCFDNWFERMQMCINLRGEYLEKQSSHLKLPTVLFYFHMQILKDIPRKCLYPMFF